jgi:hypothetical protein
MLIISIPIYSCAVTQDGTISFVALESTTKNAVQDLTFDIYQIGIENEQGDFEYSIGFEESNLDVEIFTEENINIINQYAVSNAKPVYTKTTDVNGEFTVSELQKGAYLIVQTTNQDKYTAQAMLVQVPEVTTDGNENYNITVKPKISEVIIEDSKSVDENALPYTGVLNWPIPVLAVIAIIVFCIGWLKSFTSSKKKVN